jgi:ATP-dependent RNA helicase DDX5/DBP2
MSIRRICSRLVVAPSASALASSHMMCSPAARHFASLLAAASRSSGAFTSSTVRLSSHHTGAPHAPSADHSPADSASQKAAASAAAEAAHRVIIVKDHQGKVVPNPPSFATFDDIPNTPQWLKDGLKRLGYPSTTDIQGITIPQLLEGNDVIGLAPTGSGKTVAFAVPALTMFERSPKNLPTILVLAPTRELVQQTCKVFQDLGGRHHVRVCEAYGGAPRETQSMRINRGCDVLVACPGRLKDFLESGIVSLEHLRFLVFDEADRMLDMGFKIQLDEILQYVDSQAPRQTMMWSATWPTSVQRIASEYLSPTRLMIRAGAEGTGAQVNHRIKQHIHFAEGIESKVEQLALLIENGTIKEDGCKMMIFVERQTDTETVANLLSRRLGIRGSNLGVLHGGMQQRRRDYVMQSFKDNECRILVATDVASRGLDFPDVTVVVNFAAPKDIDSYCHRIGRTGRAGRHGDAHSFLDGNDGALAKDLIPYLKLCSMTVPEPLHELSMRQSYRNNFRRGPRRGGGGGGGGYGRGGGGGRGGYQRSSGFDHEESFEGGGGRNYSRNSGGGGGYQQRGDGGRGGGRSWHSDGFDM